MTPLNVVRWCNLTLTFVLELVALAALSYAGARLGTTAAASIALAIAAPLVAAICWQWFAAPRAIKQIPAAKAAVKLCVFTLATIAIYANNHSALAAIFSSVVVVNALTSRALGVPTQTSHAARV
jgi:hypothetical protein